MITNWFKFLALSACVASAACGRIEFEPDELTVATELMNQRRYDEANLILENLNHDPKGYEPSRISILFASSLAGSIGIDVVELFSILGERFFRDPLIDSVSLDGSSEWPQKSDAAPELPDVQNSEKKRDSASKLVDVTLVEAAKISFEALDVLNRLPHTPAAHRPRLNRAMAELRTIDSKDKRFRSARLYLAMLDIIQFSNALRDLINESGGLDIANAMNWQSAMCKLKPTNAINQLFQMTFFLQEGFLSLHDANMATVSSGFKSLQRAAPALADFNKFYRNNAATFEFVAIGHDLFRAWKCRE